MLMTRKSLGAGKLALEKVGFSDLQLPATSSNDERLDSVYLSDSQQFYEQTGCVASNIRKD